MKQTTNYQLNQWELTDRVLMGDFNSDNQKIDAAIAAAARGNCRIVTGSYEGDGTYGQDHPNKLTFDSQPLLVVMQGDTSSFFAVQGSPSISTFYRIDHNMPELYVNWPENGISWYSTHSAPVQGNTKGQTYRYVALLQI